MTFNQFPPHARIWIYQADRNLTEAENTYSEQVLAENIQKWAAHGDALQASVKIFFKRFVIIVLNEDFNQASGCSIDASTRWLKELGQELSIDFFDRNLVFWSDNQLQSLQLIKVKESIANQVLTPETIIFNNNLQKLNDLNENWQLKASKSWLKRYWQS